MFNEKNDCWIKIYKAIVIAIFFIWVIFGVVAGIGDATSEYLDVGIGGDDDLFLDFFVWVAIGTFVGFVHLASNMIMIQFLNNVQVIRKKLEGK
jgi:hypothetical protein